MNYGILLETSEQLQKILWKERKKKMKMGFRVAMMMRRQINKCSFWIPQ